MLAIVPVKVQQVEETHRGDLRQGTPYKVASVASPWQFVLSVRRLERLPLDHLVGFKLQNMIYLIYIRDDRYQY